MRQYITGSVAAVVLALGAANSAHAQVGAYWAYKGGHFKPENGGWAEYQNGKKVFTFNEVSRGPGSIDIFDGSRGIRVRISGQKANVMSEGKVVLSYQGNWHWTEWDGRNANGVLIRFKDNGNGTWSEFQGKNPAGAAFTFTCVGRWQNDHVRLYDNTRGIYVDLWGDRADVSFAGEGVGFSYKGKFVK